MGTNSWSSADYSSYRTSTGTSSAKTAADVFKSATIDPAMDPKNFEFRESCDPEPGKAAVPIIIGCDVTGSMDRILHKLVMEGIPTIAKELFDRKPVEHPNLCCMAVGDVMCDRYPLQVTQFEADIKITEQSDKLYLERGGGGNNSESYTLPWLFAAMNVKSDHITKRNKKGFLITFGDDGCPPSLSPTEVERVFGKKLIEASLSAEELYRMVSRNWEVYHVNLMQGSTADRAYASWNKVLGERALQLDDYTKLGELIVSLIQMSVQNMSAAEVAATWDGSTAVVLNKTLSNVPAIKEESDNLIIL